MSQRSLIQDAARRIQDLVASALGRSLPREAEIRLENILQSVANSEVASVGDSYSRREVTILLADLRGFAAIAESFPGRVVLDVLNRCFSIMTEVIAQHYGTIDKFMGDAIMVVFSGDQRAPHDHARRALLCAVQMQIAMNELRERHKEENVPEMFLGIGINTGHVLAGLIGSDLYRAHTVIGEEVNLASRIEAFSLRGQVLISEATYALCQDFAETGEPVHVYMKGKAAGVTIREVKAIPSLGKVVPRQELRRSARVDVQLAFVYQMMDQKTVLPEAAGGTIHDIGYDGMLAQVDRPLPLYTELRLKFDLVSLGYRAEDLYGRVVEMRERGGRHFAGIEFTSMGEESNQKIRLFVQMMIQKWISAPRPIRGPEAAGEAAYPVAVAEPELSEESRR
ncbi:MAG TPA: adenylate/guanylate cyclase domain-containing protein [Xanthobacteraceae bacterium]